MAEKTVLQIIPALETGGAERTTVDIASALDNRGWKALVASEPGRLTSLLEEKGGEWLPFRAASKNPLVILRNALRLARIIRERRVDLVHARSRAPAWSALIASRLTGVPLVTTCHGKLNQKTWIKGFYNSVMTRADVVITNSAFTDKMVRSRHPRANNKTTIIHRGIDIAHFNGPEISADRQKALLDAWNLNSEQRIILNLGRLTEWKGQRVLIEAAALFLPHLPGDVVIIIAGGDQGRSAYRQGLDRQIQELGLETRVRLVGHCDDPEAAMALSELAIVASIEAETFGRAAAEAQALEKPVIVTDLGAVPETVLSCPHVSRDERTGWRVEAGNPTAIADAVEEVFSLPDEERQAMGKRGRAHVVRNFSLKQMCDKTLKVYDQLLGL